MFVLKKINCYFRIITDYPVVVFELALAEALDAVLVVACALSVSGLGSGPSVQNIRLCSGS